MEEEKRMALSAKVARWKGELKLAKNVADKRENCNKKNKMKMKKKGKKKAKKMKPKKDKEKKKKNE